VTAAALRPPSDNVKDETGSHYCSPDGRPVVSSVTRILRHGIREDETIDKSSPLIN
jgi:hypothetical protein